MLEKLADKVNILKLSLHPRRKKLFKPIEVEGRQFSEELVHEFEPYHRKVPAQVTEAESDVTITVRELADVTTEMLVDYRGQQLPIEKIGKYEQGFEVDGKHTTAVFTVLTCGKAAE